MRKPSLSPAAANAAADAVGRMLTGGRLCIYAGKKPATAAELLTDQVLLTEHVFGTFAPAVAGLIRTTEISPEPSAKATGTATFYRTMTADGAAVQDGSVGTEDADMVLSTVKIEKEAKVSIGSFTYEQQAD